MLPWKQQVAQCGFNFQKRYSLKRRLDKSFKLYGFFQRKCCSFLDHKPIAALTACNPRKVTVSVSAAGTESWPIFQTLRSNLSSKILHISPFEHFLLSLEGLSSSCLKLQASYWCGCDVKRVRVTSCASIGAYKVQLMAANYTAMLCNVAAGILAILTRVKSFGHVDKTLRSIFEQLLLNLNATGGRREREMPLCYIISFS